jgi:hypothetical protein
VAQHKLKAPQLLLQLLLLLQLPTSSCTVAATCHAAAVLSEQCYTRKCR